MCMNNLEDKKTFILQTLYSSIESGAGDKKYIKKYLDLCFSNNKDSIYEEHHILPSKQFKKYSNKKQNAWNICKLSPKKHILAHYYLALGVHGLNNEFKYKPLWHTVNLMLNTRNFSGELSKYDINKYSCAREQFIKSITYIQRNMTPEKRKLQKDKEKNTKLSKINSDGLNSFQAAGVKSAQTLGKEGCVKRSLKAKETCIKNNIYEKIGKINSIKANKIEDNGLKMSQNRALKGHETRKLNPEKQKETSLKHSENAKRTIICPYCFKEGNIANMKRWHFENCKLKKRSKYDSRW